MRRFKRILAVLAVVLCVVGILLAAAAVIGVWRANGPLTDTLVKTVSGLEKVVEGIGAGVERLTTGLNAAEDAVLYVEDTVTVAGETLAKTSPVLDLLSKVISEQLVPSVASARETARSIGESTLAVNSALDAMNTLPFVSVPTLPPELMSLAQTMTDLESEAMRAAQEVKDMKLSAVESVVTLVTERTGRMLARLNTAEEKADSAAARLSATQSALAELRARLPFYLDLASVILTLVLAWLILAQACLFSRALATYRSAGPALAPPQTEAAPVSGETKS